MKSSKNKKTNYKKKKNSKKNINKIKKAGANTESNPKQEFINHRNQASFLSFRKKLTPDLVNLMIHARKYIRTDDDITKAVNHWCSDPIAAGRIYGHISDWDTSRVTDMKRLFLGKYNFNDDISRWDVSNVVDMYGIFVNCLNFNQDIAGWDVSNVLNMDGMFSMASIFNNGGQPGESSNPLGWDVSNVKTMNCMFSYTSFNQDIGDWDVSNVNNMLGMFRFTDFNQDIGRWDVSNVTNMEGMFVHASIFNNGGKPGESNNPLEWDVSNVTNMDDMFRGATSFNQDISKWNNRRARDLVIERMFENCPIDENHKPTQ